MALNQRPPAVRNQGEGTAFTEPTQPLRANASGFHSPRHQRRVRLRITAILSNVAFITYGALNWLPPVLALHLLLLPVNVDSTISTVWSLRLPSLSAF